MDQIARRAIFRDRNMLFANFFSLPSTSFTMEAAEVVLTSINRRITARSTNNTLIDGMVSYFSRRDPARTIFGEDARMFLRDTKNEKKL